MKRTSTFLLRTVGGVSFLVPVRRNRVGNDIFYLNQMGAHIWNEAENCATPDALVQKIAQHFGVERDVEAWAGIQTFVQELVDIGLLEAP